MALLNGSRINYSKRGFSGAFSAVMGHEENPLVALERGCLTTTPLGACATARAEEQRSGGGAFFSSL